MSTHFNGHVERVVFLEVSGDVFIFELNKPKWMDYYALLYNVYVQVPISISVNKCEDFIDLSGHFDDIRVYMFGI